VIARRSAEMEVDWIEGEDLGLHSGLSIYLRDLFHLVFSTTPPGI
jgi:hypothetical protein